MFSKNKILNAFIISFALTILVNNYLQDFLLSSILFLFISVLFFNFLIYKNSKKKLVVFYIFITIWFLFWITISSFNLEKININEKYLEKYYLREYNYAYEIKELYKKDESYNSYIVKVKKIWDDIVDKNINWLVYLPSNYIFNKADTIQTNSTILVIDKVDKFDYKNYMLSKSIYFKSYVYDLKLVSKWEWILTKLELFRMKILDSINKIYPKEEAILLSWILIWARESIPNDLKESFNNSWTTHFIAVSWFNITILTIFFWYLFKFFPLILRTALVLWFLITFCIFVWLEASVVRAWIMWILWYLVSVSWRNPLSITLLLLTWLVMVLYNPFYISYDVSFHLSFLAVLWILFFKDYFDKLFSFLPNLLSIRDSLTLTFSALSLTIPIVFFNFWQVSLLSPISNITFAWTIPFIMLLWFISVITFFINSAFWIFVWLFAFIFLKWDILIVKFFWSLDKFILKVDFWVYAIFLELLYFIVLAYVIILMKNKKH